MTRKRRLTLAVLGIVAIWLLVSLPSWWASTPRRDPMGETFPSVVGTSLDGREYRFPEDFRGEPLLLLIGYVQDAQFDLDRWLLGLMQAEVRVKAYEVPTIAGMVPRMISGYIDGGMRRGIPDEDWGSVVTVYGGAHKIVALTGDENPNNGRIVLLDEHGKVIWFWDQGYSARRVLDLEKAVEQCGQGR